MNLTHLRIAAAGAFLAVLFSCSGNGGPVTGDLDVIPKPQVLIEKEDAAPFAVTRSTEIVYPADNEKLARTAEFLASYIEEVTGVKVRLSDTPGKHSIILSFLHIPLYTFVKLLIPNRFEYIGSNSVTPSEYLLTALGFTVLINSTK